MSSSFSEEQNEKIKQMRQQGVGYNHIANEVGLSRDSVRGYCKRHGLDGFGEKLALHVLDDILLILK